MTHARPASEQEVGQLGAELGERASQFLDPFIIALATEHHGGNGEIDRPSGEWTGAATARMPIEK